MRSKSIPDGGLRIAFKFVCLRQKILTYPASDKNTTLRKSYRINVIVPCKEFPKGKWCNLQ